MSAGEGDSGRKEWSGTGFAASGVSGSSAGNLTPAPSSERISRSSLQPWFWKAAFWNQGMMSAAESTNVSTSEYTDQLEMGLILGGGGEENRSAPPRPPKVALGIH